MKTRRPRARFAAVAVAIAVALPAPHPAPRPHDPAAAAQGPAGSGWLSDWHKARHLTSAGCLEDEPRRLVEAIGDSITVAGSSALETQLGLLGVDSCVDAYAGRPSSESLDAARSLPATGDASVLVMAVGSNDIFDPDEMPRAVASALALAHGRPLVWVNVCVHRTLVSATMRAADLRNSRRVNAVIAAAARTHRNLAIVDWYGYVTAAPAREALVLADGVHPTELGTKGRTQLIVGAVRRALGS